MIKKDISNYTKQEKMKLLIQWWYSNSEKKELVRELEKFDRLDVLGDSKLVLEMSEFMKIIDNVLDMVLKTAIIDYAFGDDSARAREAMKKGKFYTYCNKHLKIFDDEQYYEIVKNSINTFLDELLAEYNDDFANGEGLVDKILSLSKPYTEFKCNALTGLSVLTLYNRCLVDIKDIETGVFSGDILVGEGIKGCSLFSADKINTSRGEIEHMLSNLSNKIQDGISYDEFCKTYSGYKWGNDIYADMLIKLGTASMLLYFPAPREDWEYLPGGKPYIAATDQKDRIIFSNKDDEYISIINNIRKR